jgi:hypothetical protein
VIVVLVLVVRGGEPTPQQLYVAPWGNADWPGTAERPLATPAAAQQVVRERTVKPETVGSRWFFVRDDESFGPVPWRAAIFAPRPRRANGLRKPN